MSDSCNQLELQNRIKRGVENAHFAISSVQSRDFKTALRDVERAIDLLIIVKLQIENMTDET
jgi:hypothetical protein